MVRYMVAVAVLLLSATDVATRVTTVALKAVAGATNTAEVAVHPVMLPQAGLHAIPDCDSVHLMPLLSVSFWTEALNC